MLGSHVIMHPHYYFMMDWWEELEILHIKEAKGKYLHSCIWEREGVYNARKEGKKRW